MLPYGLNAWLTLDLLTFRYGCGGEYCDEEYSGLECGDGAAGECREEGAACGGCTEEDGFLEVCGTP